MKMNNWKMSKTMIVICCLLALAAVALLAWSVADDSAPGWVLPAALGCVALGNVPNIIRIFRKDK